MTTPRLLERYICPEHGLPMVSDSFAGEGGTTRGLMAAGYCVTAVDNDKNRLSYNPAQHKVHGDAIAFIVEHGWRFLWNWGSPTCTGYSRGTVAVPDRIGKYDRLIAATREAFTTAGRPWLIENVEDAARLGEIRNPQLLCGYVPRSKAVREALLGITGMTGKGLELSIPPVYAEHIGRRFLAQIERKENAA